MKNVVFILCFVFCYSSHSQSKFEELTDYFEDYAELSREQIYVHLNKSTFISAETIWFKSYIVSRDTNELSAQTSNLYCVLLDDNDQVIKEKMIMSVHGIGNAQFETDSTFTSGEYKVRAYTNWSKNFSGEYTHYEAKFLIVNPDEKKIIKPVLASDKIDVQILPESGHFLADIKNRVGIIAKDSIGLGIANLRVKVLENGELLKEIQLNQFGIGALELSPNIESRYSVEFNYNNKKRATEFPRIENKGLVINLEDSSANLAVHIRTNTETINTINNEIYKLTVHNTVEMVTYDFVFQDKKSQVFNFEKKQLFTGINIITLFNSKAQPIAERLYFNFNGLNFGDIENPITSATKDSIDIKLPLKSVDMSKFHSFSISVLPSKTKSYKHHNTIISAQLLQPFLKNPIQNAGYYFRNIDDEKKSDLDLLLLTEGWSRYSWNSIFNNPPEYNYDFEVGVSYNLNSNSDEASVYFVYPNLNTKTELLTIESGGSVKKSGFFPLANENLRIGKLSNKNKLGSAQLVVQFFPSKIPSLTSKFKALSSLGSYQAANYDINYEGYSALSKVQKLDEVKVTKKKEYTRIEKIKNRSIGKVIEFDEKKRRFYRTFAQFISSYGFTVNETPTVDYITQEFTIFRIFNTVPVSINASLIPIIFLDDVPLTDYNILSGYSMRNIDYVEINKSGVGEGIRGGAGVIRIYNKPITGRIDYPKKDVFTSYEIPVTFDRPKVFYAPIYGSFKTKFFEDYGVIDWRPKLEVKDGYLAFKVLNTGQPIKLYIEGIMNNSELLSQELSIEN